MYYIQIKHRPSNCETKVKDDVIYLSALPNYRLDTYINILLYLITIETCQTSISDILYYSMSANGSPLYHYEPQEELEVYKTYNRTKQSFEEDVEAVKEWLKLQKHLPETPRE